MLNVDAMLTGVGRASGNEIALIVEFIENISMKETKRSQKT